MSLRYVLIIGFVVFMVIAIDADMALGWLHKDGQIFVCFDCHVQFSPDEIITPGPSLIKEQYEAINLLCRSCHSSGGPGTDDITHIELESGAIDCTACHNPHRQEGDNIKLVRKKIKTPGGKWKNVTFTAVNPIYADGDSVRDGVCEVCHTQTMYHRSYELLFSIGWTQAIQSTLNDPNANPRVPSEIQNAFAAENTQLSASATVSILPDDTWEITDAGMTYTVKKMGSELRTYYYSPSHNEAQQDCTVNCHKHDMGFSGMGGGVHSIHTDTGGELSLSCEYCHGATESPSSANGNLSGTTVCSNCHSPGGFYDGVNDPAIGAKNNWVSGVYSGGTLAAGKEKWCAGCHDDQPAIIAGVSAPKVVGDETAITNYGMGYGFYKTGHGLPSFDAYPASGTTVFGAGMTCEGCHDATMTHIDGEPRTYDAASGTPNYYQAGYRLRSVNGEVPMVIPRENECNEPILVKPDDFRLCFGFGCHDSGPFTNSSNYSTNFRRDRDPGEPFNAHYSHLEIKKVCGQGPSFSSDWSYLGWDSRESCVTCHNVHGSTQLSMVRDGKLVNREPGLQLAYYNDTVSYSCPTEPSPADVKLQDSTGTVWNKGATGYFCGTCHGSCGYDTVYTRAPADVFPPEITSVYGDLDSDILTVNFSEGVYTDPGDPTSTGALTEDDFALIDTDNNRTINSVTHAEGTATATLTLSATLDSTDDIETDTLSAATATSIYDIVGNPMDITPVVILPNDITQPAISGQNPADGASDVAVDGDITFVLSDSDSGVEWTTFSIHLSGNRGYSETYEDTDTFVVSKTGTPDNYSVTVSPDTNFGGTELITATVNVSDLAANAMTPAEWSFTTLGPTLVTLHPSGMASNPGGFWTVDGDWPDVLDTIDADATYTTSNTGSPGAELYIDMDDPVGLGGASINGITIYVYARYVSGWSPSPLAIAANVNIGYKTGTGTIWKGNTTTDASGNYNLITSSTYNTDSDLGSLDLTDINDLQIAVKRMASGSTILRVTEIHVEITYTP